MTTMITSNMVERMERMLRMVVSRAWRGDRRATRSRRGEADVPENASR